MAFQPAFADHGDDRDDHEHEHEHDGHARTAVPELSSHGAAAGFALIAGGAAIALGRRRSRKA